MILPRAIALTLPIALALAASVETLLRSVKSADGRHPIEATGTQLCGSSGGQYYYCDDTELCCASDGADAYVCCSEVTECPTDQTTLDECGNTDVNDDKDYDDDYYDCFAGSSLVTLESGATIQMAEVRVGDRILTADASGQFSFSDVVFVPHAPNTEKASFVDIQTSTHGHLKLTAEHLLLVNEVCLPTPSFATSQLMYAKNVRKGMCVVTADGSEEVVNVARVVELGLYTAVTNNEYVVVNGVVASPFSWNHAVPNIFYNIHRTIYAMGVKATAPQAWLENLHYAVARLAVTTLRSVTAV